MQKQQEFDEWSERHTIITMATKEDDKQWQRNRNISILIALGGIGLVVLVLSLYVHLSG